MKKLLLFFMTFFTLLGYAQFPEGFESTTFPPTGWAAFDNGIGTFQWIRTTSFFRTGVACARINGQNVTDGTTSIDWLASPSVLVPANGQVRFYARKTQTANFGSTYTIRVAPAIPATNQNNPAAYTTVQTWTETDFDPTLWQQKFVPLTAYIGQNVFIAFVMENDNGDRWLIDDVKVDSQCLTPTALAATPLATSAMLSWNSPNPAGPWEIEYGPVGFTPGATPSQGTIIQSTTNPRNITGLSPLTSYDFYVRTMCDVDNPSPWSVVRNFRTSELPPGCGGNFVDNGGSTGTYLNNSNNSASPVVICPTNTGDLVTVTFTSFNTETNWDALYVYDGPDTSSPLISSGNPAGNVPGGLAGGYWGTTIPGPFTSTHPSGCLTFVFRSDGSGVRDGWTANVTCAPPPNYCAGDHFYDLGGPTGNYPNNLTSTRGYTKICPNAGQSVTVFFNSFDVANDTFSIYDGDNLATALLVGTYSGTNVIPSYTASNPTGNGCLIFVFTSNSSINAAGWDASIVCGPPCQAITSSIASSNPAPAADTVIKVCQDQVITFNGAATFGTSGTGAIYHWNFGDNTTAVGQNVTHSYPNPGIYSISLYTIDQSGCRSVNRINQLVYVSTDPNFTGTEAADDEICLGQSTTIAGVVNPTTFNRECAPPVSGTTFLPDGSGVSYQTQVPVDCFALGSTLTSASQITSVCLNMEHSYLGDLQIQLISPSGQSIILKAYNGTGGGGGGTYLGCPNDDPSTVPGTGRTYCFTPTATTYLVNGPTSACGSPSSASVNAGNYMPVQPFTNLIGSTLNGNWTIVVTDNLTIDNGYIFDWSIDFDSSLINTDYSFTPTIVSSFWSPNPSIVSTSGQTITVTPTVLGTTCYTYNVVDNFGCAYSHEVCIETTPGVTMTTNTASPLSVFVGQNGTFNFSGGTPLAVVTYNINGGANQTVTLSATGTATVTVNALTVDTTLTVTGIAEQPIPTSGNVILTTGGGNPTNSHGPISPVGTLATNLNISTTLNSTTTSARFKLAHQLPIGTVVTISIARNSATGRAQISDGVNTTTFSSGPSNSTLQRIQFTMGAFTDQITITQNVGTIYVDGMSYTFNLLGCDAPLNLPATIEVETPPYPFITSISNNTICSGSDAVFNIVGSGNTTVTYSIDGGANQTILLNAAGTGTITVPNSTNNVVLLISQIQLGTDIDTTPLTRTITVNPLGQINTITDEVVCNGGNTTAVTFSTTNTGGTTTYTWTNDNTAIGLAASSAGNVTGIPSFVATNTTTAPITGTITVTPTYTNGGVSCTGATEVFTITVNPSGKADAITDEVVCNGGNTTAVTFSTTNTGGTTTYTWTNDNTAIGLAASSAGNVTGIPSFVATNTTTAPITGTITVTPTYTNGGVSCTGATEVFTITVNPTAQVNAVTDDLVCNGGNTTAVTFSTTNTGGTTTYTWTNNNTAIGLAASSAGNVTGIPSFVATNTTTAPITGTITVTPTYTNGGVSCTGATEVFTITVNPSGKADAITDEVVCNGGNTTAVTFSTTNTGGTTTYTWTNNNTAIGLAASSAGNVTGIPSFVATNTTTAPITGTITVTPTYTNGGVSCTGATEVFTITVNPTAQVNAVTDDLVCNGGNTTAVTFSTINTGGTTTYTWTNDNTAIGLAASSAGNVTGISSFVATNTTTAPITGTITVTPTYTNGGVSCTGATEVFTITVNPTAQVNAVSDDLVCNGGNTTAVTFSTTNTGGTTTYTWTNDNTAIGLAASSTGNVTGIPSFVATNTTTTPITGTITLTPTYTNGGVSCTGATEVFTITVNPSGKADIISDEVICNGGNTSAVTFSTANAGGTTTYTWANDNTAIGLAASSGGNVTGIPSFVATNTTTAPITGTITVTPTYTNGGVSCTGVTEVFTITVNPTAQVNAVTDDLVCNGGNTTAVTFSTTNTGGTTTYTWTNNNTAIGLAASSAGNVTGIPSFVATNTTTAPITGTITVTPTYTNGGVSCTGATEVFTITVNPSGKADAITDEVVCNGGNTTAVTFSTTNTGGTTTYTWTNNNTAIGLAASSAGNVTGIPSFVATNTTTAPITGTITVTPTYTNGGVSCTGATEVFTITVNPTAQVNAVTDDLVCNGGNTTAVTFSTINTGGTTTYTWTNDNTAIGLAASSAGNVTGISSFVATNTTTAPITGTITVTPTYTNGGVSCTGATEVFTITVNPTAQVNAVSDDLVCNGGNTTAVTFSTTNTGGTTTYTWTNDNTAIGLAASSTGNVTGIPSFVATNTTTTPITGTITVTPTYTNGGVSCTGATETYTITVNPTPTLILSSAVTTTNQTICVNSPIVPIQYTFGSGATGVTVTGLPAGINPSISGNIVTISGTPTTTAAIFNYTITATGSLCGAPALTGVIEVTNGILPLFAQVAPVCQGATINIPTSSNNLPPIVGVWNLISSTANDVTYEFTPNAGQCGLNTTMTIVVHPLPTVIPSVTTQSFCSGGTTNINLTSNVAGATFSWTATATTITGQSGSVTGSGATSINQTLILNANQVAAGQVTYVIVAESNGCLGAPVTVVVTVNPIPNVIVSPASLAQTICSGQATNISFSGAINNTVYSWSVVSSVGVSGALNGNGTAINQILTTTGLSQGTVVYEVTPSLNGCTGTPQRITVTVNPVPEIFGSATHPDLCSGESTFISVSTFNATTVFNWTVDPIGVSGASAGTATGSSILIAQALTTTGNAQGYVDYIITPVLTGCPGLPITVRVHVNPLPVVSLTDGTICVDAAGVPFQTYLLDSGLNDVNYDFVWTFEGNTIPGATNATYTATQVGTYTVVATNSTTNCVSNIASAVVTATNPATSLTVTQSEYFSDNAILTVNVTGGNGTLLYQLDQGALQESNVFTGVSAGLHIITVVDTQGCTYLTKEVLVIDYPKYFTPNGDGHNDTWNIIGLNQPDAKLYIFDRYGKLVKQIVPSSLSNGWDGTYNNVPMPSTDYWFTLDYTENGAQKQFKAHFSLKR